MSKPYDACTILQALVGETLHTLTGRSNRVLAVEGDNVRVGTSRSPSGQLVRSRGCRRRWIGSPLDGEVAISVESVGYRSAFIGAVLSSLDDTESPPATMRVRCKR